MKRLLRISAILTIVLMVGACDNSEEQDKALVKEARDTLLLSDKTDNVTHDIALPTEMSNYENVKIEWESDNIDYLTNEGSVIRPEFGAGDQSIILKATLTYNDAQSTKEFPVNILELEQLHTYESIEKLHQDSKYEDRVKVSGTIQSLYEDGFFITDGFHHLAIDASSITERYELSDSVELIGQYDREGRLYQLTDIEGFHVLSDEEKLSTEKVESTLETLANIDLKERIHSGQSHLLKGEIIINEEGISIQSLTNDSIVNIHPDSAGDIEEIFNPLQYEIIEAELILYDENKAGEKTVLYNNSSDDIDVLELDFEDEFNEDIQNEVNHSFIYDTSISLPSLGYNKTSFIDWTSNHPEVLDDEGNLIDSPDSNTIVTFTGTAELRQYTKEVSFDVEVASHAVKVGELSSFKDGDMVHTEGTVLSLNPHDQGFIIQDEDGEGIHVRITQSDNALFDSIEVGDSISLHGMLGRYTSYSNNQRQIGGHIRITNHEDDGIEPIIIDDATQTDIINNYQSYNPDESTDQPGGGTDAKRYIIKDVIFDSKDPFNYILIKNDETSMNLTFDLAKAEGLTVDDFKTGTEISKIIFTTEKIHFNNYRIIDVKIHI